MRANEYQSHLFMVRLWQGEGGDQVGWAGKVQHVTSGEAHTFGDLQMLAIILLSMLPELNEQQRQINAGGKRGSQVAREISGQARPGTKLRRKQNEQY
jgi:hypothetical protein